MNLWWKLWTHAKNDVIWIENIVSNVFFWVQYVEKLHFFIGREIEMINAHKSKTTCSKYRNTAADTWVMKKYFDSFAETKYSSFSKMKIENDDINLLRLHFDSRSWVTVYIFHFCFIPAPYFSSPNVRVMFSVVELRVHSTTLVPI